MSSFSEAIRKVGECLTHAGIQYGVATSLIGLDILSPDGPRQPTRSSEAHMIVRPTDLPRANAALTTAGFLHRVIDGLDVYLDAPDRPLDQGVIVASPTAAPVVMSIDVDQLRANALRRAAHERREGPVDVSARKQIDLLIAKHIAPGLRAAGFKKSARSFGRRVGSIVHAINFQGSQWSNVYAGSFYINLGVWSDNIAKLEPYRETAPELARPFPKSGVPSPTWCHVSGRIDDLAPKLRTVDFECRADDPNTEVIEVTRKAIFEHAVPFFDAITSDEELLRHCESPKQRLHPTAMATAALRRLLRPMSEFDAHFDQLIAGWASNPELASQAERTRQRLRAAVIQ